MFWLLAGQLWVVTHTPDWSDLGWIPVLVTTHTSRQNPIPVRFWRVFPEFHAAIRPKAPPSRLEPPRTASIQFETSSLGIHPKKFQIGWRSFSPRKALQTVWFSVKALYGCGVQRFTQVHIQLNSFVWESYQTAKSARFFPLFSASINHRGARPRPDHVLTSPSRYFTGALFRGFPVAAFLALTVLDFFPIAWRTSLIEMSWAFICLTMDLITASRLRPNFFASANSLAICAAIVVGDFN